MNNKIFLGLFLGFLVIGLSGCIQKAPGDISVTVDASQDVGWCQNFNTYDFGTLTRGITVDSYDDVLPVNSSQGVHRIEIINGGMTPVNVEVMYTSQLLTDPDSTWSYSSKCRAINANSGNIYSYSGECTEGARQDAYTPINSGYTNVATCLKYRAESSSTKPGLVIDQELVVSYEESLGSKTGTILFQFTTADVATDCGGNSGFDPI